MVDTQQDGSSAAASQLSSPRGPAAFPTFAVRDGRYLGTNGRWWLDVRVDIGGSGMISADLHAAAPGNTLVEVSAATTGTGCDASAGRWDVQWSGEGDRQAPGWLSVRSVADVADSYTFRFHLGGPLGELAGSTTIVARLARVGDALRHLGLEVEVEQGVALPRAVMVEGQSIDAEECLRRIGFEVHGVGAPTTVAAPDGGRWSGVDVLETLNRQLADAAQAPLGVPAWEAHLLMLSRSERPGLLGVMFDFVDDRPRQGAAVFVEEIRRRYPDREDAERRIIQSTVHELGHVLNLSHRFSVGHWDSPSPMNYDWCYRGGRQAEQFQRDYTWTFDPDELAFLRHGRRPAVIPGGDAFGSSPYWSDAGDGSGSRVRDAAAVRLWLTPPDRRDTAGVATFAHGQPIFLGVSLANTTGRPVLVPRTALDVKAGQLEVRVRRLAGRADSGGSPDVPFVPIMRRCYDIELPSLVCLGAGQSLHDNVNLAFASTGHMFTEPGRYEIVPALNLPGGDPDGPGAVVRVTGSSLTVVVEPPLAAAEKGTEPLRQATVDVSMAMGGFAGREPARATVSEFRGRRTREGAGVGDDRVMAAIDRVLGIDAGRRRDFTLAASLLTAATRHGISAFDPHTVEQTRRLAARYRAASRAPGEGAPSGAAPAVVVDLAVRSGPGRSEGGRVAGALQVDALGQGWAVIAPADALPPHAMNADADIEAHVTVAGKDGLVERLPVPRVDLIGRADGTAPEVALLWLPRSLPGTPTPRFDPGVDGTTINGQRTLWQILGAQGVTAADLGERRDSALDQWDSAASLSLAALPEAIPTPAASHTPVTPTDFDDVAGWVCRVLPVCDEAEPPTTEGGAPNLFNPCYPHPAAASAGGVPLPAESRTSA